VIPGLLIRPATPNDNGEILRLTQQLTIPARVPLVIDRAPDFTAFDRTAGAGFDIIVAEIHGRLVGLLETRYLRLVLGNEPIWAAYFALAGVEPSQRGRGIYLELITEAERLARAADARIGLTLVNDRNQRQFGFLTQRFGVAVPARHITVSSYLVGPRYPTPAGFSCEPAPDSELTAVVDLLRRCHGEHIISHNVTAETLTRPGLLRLLVARSRTGRVCACLGICDQRGLRRTIVRRYPRRENLLRRVVNATRSLTGIAALPAPGGELRILHAIYAAAEPGHEHAFAALLRHACNRLRGYGHHLLVVGLPDGDRLGSCLRGLLRISGGVVPLLFLPEELDQQLGAEAPSVRFEYALA